MSNRPKWARGVAKSTILMGMLASFPLGCSPDVKPKGTGASGKVTQIATESIGLEQINKLDAQQQRSLDWLHRPFEKAVTLAPDLTPEETQLVDKIKGAWDSFIFVDLLKDAQGKAATNGYKALHLAKLETEHGDLEFQFLGDYAPDHVRSFLVMVEQGLFDGKTLTVKDGLAWFGIPEDKSLYSLEPAIYAASLRSGVLVTSNMDGKSDGTKFALTLVEKPELSGKVTILGGTLPTSNAKVLELIAEAGTSVIKKVSVEAKPMPLFSEKGANLPSVGEDGRPVMSVEGIPKEVLDRQMAEP